MLKRIGVLVFSASMAVHTVAAEVEVLHFWTSASEAQAADVIKEAVEARGHTWLDFAVAGGGGENARAVLAQRVATGIPPVSSQMKGTEIPQWAQDDVLANLNPLAKQENWDSLIPASIAPSMKYDDKYVAVPINIHRLNWMWVNLDVMKASGIDTLPTSMDGLLGALAQIKEAGFIPLAHGSQPWQDTVLFESVVLSVGGTDLYHRAFVDLDRGALDSKDMVRSFEAFRALKQFTDPRTPGRDWNIATSLVISGEAGVQIMGDWAKGEFISEGMVLNEDYTCVAAPGTEGAFSYTVDSFTMFKTNDAQQAKAQQDFALTLMDETVQRRFNLVKGSIPVRKGVSSEGFDECAKTAMADFEHAGYNRAQVPSVATHMAMTLDRLSNVYEVVSDFWNDDSITPEQASLRMVDAVK